jgi:hypothetical protein
MSLTGALLAVFIQQWAQSYLHATQGRRSPRERARIRIFHAEGLEKLYLHWVTRAVPILIHISLFLFFSGLPIFLFSVNRTVFNVVITWLALCVAGYACITLMPIFCQNSPYYSPLSSSTWWCVTNTLFVIYRFLKKFLPRGSSIFRWYDTHYTRSHLRWPSMRAMQRAADLFALQLSPDIDYRALLWMFETLNDDDEFEQFFDALPSLCDSEALVDPWKAFIKPNEKKLSHALIGMMDRTLLSDLVPEQVKQRRIIICTKAIGATSLLEPRWTLRRVLCGDWHGFSRSIHFGPFVQGWKNISQPVLALYVQYVVAVTLAGAQQRDDHWFQLASGQLNESKSLLWTHYAYGDSILLANAIFVIRRTLQTFSGSEDDHRKDILEASSKTMELVCRFDIKNTLVEHQHQFCSLWNQLVDAAQNNTEPDVTSLYKTMLKSVRRLYITLHEKTSSAPTAFSTTTDDRDRVLDDARSYPRCRIDGLRHSTPAPELQLNGLPGHPRNAHHFTAHSIDMTPALSSSVLFSGLPQTFPSPPYPLSSAALTPPFRTGLNPSHPFLPSPYHPVAPGTPPTVPPNPYYPVTPGPFNPSLPWPYNYSAPPPPPGISPPVSIPQMASRGQDIPAATGQVDSKQDRHVRFAPPASTSTSSTSASPAPPDNATTPTSNPVPAGSTPSVDGSHGTPITPTAPVPSQMTPVMSLPPSLGTIGRVGAMPILKFNGFGEFMGLLCHSPHSVLYDDELYPSALHLFEALRFLYHRSDIAERIRLCEHVEEVAAISAEMAEFTRRDWGNIAFIKVSTVID